MSDRVWYRSLYWRIALGIILLLGAVLVAQGIAFVWLVSKTPDTLPPRALQQTARALAFELETSLAQDPAIDLDRFVQERVDALSRPVVLVWRDGRVFHAGIDAPPEWLLQIARARFERRPGPGPMAPGGRARRALGLAPVQVDGRVHGLVAVLSGPGPQVVLRQLGPMLLLVALALTVGGTATAALLIFGPAHRRLRGLEDAARHLGAGEASARAPETGGDEIATVAHSFNEMAAEIVRRNEALTAADRARRQLLADVSHELMTPLTAMREYLETLRLPDLPLDPAARARYLDIVHEETLRMERLIGELLNLSRLEAGGPVLSIGRVRVADLCARVRSRLERPLLEKDVTLETRILPGAEELDADGDRIEQALQNLAANALRHTPARGRITLEAAPRPDGRVALSVSDTGLGIPAEHLPFVFDRFYKADLARATAGSGLGLSIVRAIVERHGGEVRARSTPGVETVFEILLPLTARVPTT